MAEPDMTLSRDQILSLTGTALSDAVAEHVMGWRAHVIDQLPCWLDAGGAIHFTRELEKFHLGKPLSAMVGSDFRPHEDMNAAWNVVVEVGNRRKLEWWAIHYHPGDKTYAGRRYESWLGSPASDPNPCIAICRAALLAVLSAP